MNLPEAHAKNDILLFHCPRCELYLIKKHGRTVWPRGLKRLIDVRN
jgi:hypothetical protein